ncbi:two-component response regulator ARR11-like [Andrographis paniculata]|uniref:two-component response regulator ARR11-like n=1 Tax=Andrographis paniculata TaxID=175694 RepID=UPI0021E93B35|nr:two-component response regulator ARR11-like [Andrographis paniculata]
MIGVHVIVVDMDKTALYKLAHILLNHSYTVSVRTSMQDVEKLLQLEQGFELFDLVICNADLPGLDITKFLADVAVEREIPVIMMSVDGEDSKVMEMIEGNCAAYYPKPIEEKDAKYLWQYVVRKRKVTKQHLTSMAAAAA